MSERFMKLPEVMNITALSRSTIYLKASQGTFPQPIKLSERSSAWLESEIEQWIEERISVARNESKRGSD